MRLILAGGGNASQSILTDEFYVSLLEKGNMLFLPQAISPETWSYEQAFEWIQKPIPFQNLEISIWNNLDDKTYSEVEKFESIYLMGGNTFKLLKVLRETGFDRLLSKFVQDNHVVYGISAGAIILSSSIITAGIGPEPDENTVGLSDLSGLDFLKGFIVHTHYASGDDPELFEICNSKETCVIAIPETSGIFVHDDTCSVIGSDSVFVFNNHTMRELTAKSDFLLKNI